MSGGANALATRDTTFLKFVSKARADWRASTCAALIGSGIGLSLGAAYMAGGMARVATDHARASRIANAAAGGFSETTLQRETAAMDPGVLRIASRHDPFVTTGAAHRDRQTAMLTARLERAPKAGRLRGNVEPNGALEGSRELECLTQAVYYEARGETPSGQAAVAQVVMNRVRHPAFPNSVCGVVFQGAGKRVGCQFSFACDGSMRRRRETAAWDRAQRVASRALSGAVVARVGDSTHFHTTNVAPNWGPRLVRTAEVGMHIFYRLGKGVARPAPKADDRVLYASLTAPPPPKAITVTEDLRTAVMTAEAPKPVLDDTPKSQEKPKLTPVVDVAKPAAAAPVAAAQAGALVGES